MSKNTDSLDKYKKSMIEKNLIDEVKFKKEIKEIIGVKPTNPDEDYKQAHELTNFIKEQNFEDALNVLRKMKADDHPDFEDAVSWTLDIVSDSKQAYGLLFSGKTIITIHNEFRAAIDLNPVIADLIENHHLSKVSQLLEHPQFTVNIEHENKKYDLVDLALKQGEIKLLKNFIKYDRKYNDLTEAFKSITEIEDFEKQCFEARNLAEIICLKIDQGVKINMSYTAEGRIYSNVENLLKISEFLSNFNDNTSIAFKDKIDNSNLSQIFTYSPLYKVKKDIHHNLKISNTSQVILQKNFVDENFSKRIYAKNMKDFFPNAISDQYTANSVIHNLYNFVAVNRITEISNFLDKHSTNQFKLKNPLIDTINKLDSITKQNMFIDNISDGINNSDKKAIKVAARIINNNELMPIQCVSAVFKPEVFSSIDFKELDTLKLFNRSAEIDDKYMCSVLLDHLPRDKNRKILEAVIKANDSEFFDLIIENSESKIVFSEFIKELSNSYTHFEDTYFLDTLIDLEILDDKDIKSLPQQYLKEKGYIKETQTLEFS